MLLALLFGIIEGPSKGWTAPSIVAAFAAGAVLLAVFAWWEQHVEHPLLDVSFFADARFSAASIAVTLVFFAMFGSMFFLTQYLQFVLSYDALQSGIRLLPIAGALMVAAPLSSRLVALAGTKIVVTFGLLLVAAAMAIMSLATTSSGFGLVAIVLVVIGLGMGFAMAPATDSIMGSLPPEKAGVGSAVNDTTREVGGALGVAILGSITAGVYRHKVTESPIFAVAQKQSPAGAAAIKDSVGAAAEVAKHLPASAARVLTDATNAAFVHALDRTVLVGAGVAVLGAIVAAVFLPARPAIEATGEEAYGELIAQTARHLHADPRRRRDVLGAVLQALTEAGFSSLTFHGVATRAGISTESIDRYWGSKVDLVVDALTSIVADRSVPDTGTFRGDCTQYLRELAAGLTDPRLAPAIAGLIGEASRDPELAHELRERLVGPRRRDIMTMIDRADARGEIITPVDRTVFADMLLAPLVYRSIIAGEPLGTVVADDIIDVALSGTVRTTPSSP
jgi:AcrR family transcriptional regulator